MIPARFEYRRATSADEAVALLAELGDEATLLAGGQSLLPLMKLRLAVPEALVDVGRCADLSYVRTDDDAVAIGALTRHRELEHDADLADAAPLLAHAAGHVGDPQVRSFGTIGGSVAHADPAGDYPAVLVALDATMVAQGPDGQREIAAGEFFVGPFETSLAPDELLTEIRVPRHAGVGFQKFRRRAQDWAIVGAVATRTNGATVVGLMHMGGTPVRAIAVETAIAEDASIDVAAGSAADGTSPPSDLHASAAYRRHLARVLTRRALQQLGG